MDKRRATTLVFPGGVTMFILGLLIGCSTTGRMGECQYRDEPVGMDEVGPQGITASEMMAMIGERTFDVEPNEDYGPDWAASISEHGSFTLAAEPTDARPFVRTWQASSACFSRDEESSYLHATVQARLTSSDGAFDVAGEHYVSSVERDGVEVHWTWDVDHLGLLGQVPAWVEEAAAAEQEQFCAEAHEQATTWVMPSDSMTAPELSVEARYHKRGECHYAALLAIADLVPQPPSRSTE